ncbi:MAG TPA: hypothetical protein VLE97_06325 [Gaiellaceae bacterium]|nr:hypothetical protein [Gaiellaceae bacterium]
MADTSQLLHTRRWCYWIPADGYVEGYGFRVSIVFEHEPGHYPTGDSDWITDPSKRKPWFWGHDYAEARKCAEDMNQEKLGLSPKDAAQIVTTSMVAP